MRPLTDFWPDSLFGFLSRFLPAILTLLMLVGLIMLGNWQMHRLAWKEDLLRQIKDRRGGAPMVIETGARVAALRPATHHYQRAWLIGRFGAQTVFWFTQINQAPAGLSPQERVGYHVLTPFYLRDGTPLLVDRGFVPARLKAHIPSSLTHRQKLAVVLRWPDRRGPFDADDQPAENLFYVRDPAAIGAHWRLPLPVVIGEVADSGETWPRGGQTRMKLANRHLAYAMTWYGLALVLVFISGLWHMRAWNVKTG